MFTIRKDMEFAMPPRGVTVHKNEFSGKVWKRVIWRCEEEGCWYVRILKDDKPDTLTAARTQHKEGTYGFHCPSPPMRESLPSGLPEIEKLWREVDDVTDALMGKAEYRGMSAEGLKAYAQGLAFCIVMKDVTYFPDVQSVSREAVVRWKMRNDKAPYRKTPTTQNTNGSWMAHGGWNADEHGSVSLPKPRSTETPAMTAAKNRLDAKAMKGIKVAIDSGMFAMDEIAETYKIPIELVKQIERGEYGSEVK